MRLLKKMFCIAALVGTTCFCATTPIMAQSERVSEIETAEEYAEAISYPVMRASCLSLGNVQITKLSSNSINIYGLTQCFKTCDNVYLGLYLEKKVNGSYGTYKYWDYSKKDASNLSKSLNVSVPSGYYYRVRTYHAASDNGSDKESLTCLTSGIYVG